MLVVVINRFPERLKSGNCEMPWPDDYPGQTSLLLLNTSEAKSDPLSPERVKGGVPFHPCFIGTDSKLAGVQDVLLCLIDASYYIEMS
jgi:hypothetical protein